MTMPKIRNIIIFVAILAIFALIYVYFLKPDSAEEGTLISAPQPAVPGGTAPVAGANTPSVQLGASDFLTLLLNVKNIKLEDAIFADPAFQSLQDSSIILVPDGNEGRPNPFAPLGQDITPVLEPVPTLVPAPDSGEDELLGLLNDLGPSPEEETVGGDDLLNGTI